MSLDLSATVTQLISGMDVARLFMERLEGWRAPSAEGVQVRFPSAEDEADFGKTLELVNAMERAAPGTAGSARRP